MPIFPENFVANTLSGTILVTDGFANINLATNPYALEGDKPFVIKIRKGSTSGLVIATSPTITLKDNSQVVSLTANVSTVVEGNLVTFTLVTANASDNSNVYYSILPVTANVNAQDFVGANVGKATIINNQAVFSYFANTDYSLVDETGETFKVQLRTNSVTGNIVYTTSNVAITDFYKLINVYKVDNSSSSITEGSNVTFTVYASNFSVGKILYYYTSGNALLGANSGSFILNSSSNTINIISSLAVPSGQSRNFNLVISESQFGPALITSNTITINSAALFNISASGGTTTTVSYPNGNYKVHAFTSSDNFTISQIGPGYSNGANIEYLVVAGGGGGGVVFGSPSAQGAAGGGGGGGFLAGNITITSANTYTMVVGAGGISTTFGGRGSNSSIFSNALIAVGGGAGGNWISALPAPAAVYGSYIGTPGGSGGGGSSTNTPGAWASGSGGSAWGTQGSAGNPVAPIGLEYGGGGGGAGGTSPAFSPSSGQLLAGKDGKVVYWAPSTYGQTVSGVPYMPGVSGQVFAGGGGGSSRNSTPWPTAGGYGGGGTGQTAGAGTVNTGGGGGGAGPTTFSPSVATGSGGSGIILLRYPAPTDVTTYSNVIANTSIILEGSNAFFVVNTTFGNNRILFYDTVGNVTSASFVDGNTGSFTVTSNATVLRIETTATVPTNEERIFALRIKESPTENAVLTSSNVYIYDSSVSLYITASGGNVFTSSGYRTHVFDGSNNFVVTDAGKLDSNIEYMVVAGGGAGAFFAGGGAGGMITGGFNLTSANLGTYTVSVGAGGAKAPLQGGSGSPSYIQNSGNTIHLSAMGGGGAGQYNWTSAPGGSGGGGGNSLASSIPGQGNPGTTTSPGPGIVFGGGGAGGPGAPAPTGSGGIGRIANIAAFTPAIYGQANTLGRYFAGGGGGWGPIGTGGLGGGGKGYVGPTDGGSSGNVFSGGGGGGGSDNSPPARLGGAGGSGIVIIRYPYV